MTAIQRSVISVTVVAIAAFVALGLFVHPGLLFLLAIPAPVVLFGALSRPTRKRFEMPSLICNCGGEWGKWGPVQVITRPRKPEYPLTGGEIRTHVQVRHCGQCGLADRRVLT
jgi:hypothetical protein